MAGNQPTSFSLAIMIYFAYNLLFPLVFLFFVPVMLRKYATRGGHKATYAERFAIFSKERVRELRGKKGAVWIHSVSVGETVIALAMIKKWRSSRPDLKIVHSTTTTTGQELARENALEGVSVIYCPLDFIFFVRRVVKLFEPSMLVIFETEIWPNMIREVRRRGGKVALVNARMSDRSAKAYYRFRIFFRPILRMLDLVMAQSADDRNRFKKVCPELTAVVSGNMKFDQTPPANPSAVDLEKYFGEIDNPIHILAASTHPGEEALIAQTFGGLRGDFPNARLIIVPRHAERGAEVAAAVEAAGLSCLRRSENRAPRQPVECLIADTTGEMMSFVNAADIVIMGKSLAGHDEGHNLIEPALLAKPVITGAVLRNFRFIMRVLTDAGAIVPVDGDDELKPALENLLNDPVRRRELGRMAAETIATHRGATEKTIELLENL